MTNKLALVVAVVLGVLSILGVRFYVEKIKVGYDSKVVPVDVPCASRDLKPGDVVAKSDITIQQFPRSVVDALQGSHYPANETDKFEGARVVAPIKQGQVYQQYHFRQAKISNKLPPLGSEFRAMTVLVTPVIGVAGLLRPGDKVDVIYTAGYEDIGGYGGAGGGKKIKICSTLAEKVDVLAIDGYTDPETSGIDYQTVTLKLRPLQANRLAHAIHCNWQYHLVKLDDTTSPTGILNTVLADTEFYLVEPDIKAFFEKKSREGVNRGPK